MWMSTILSTPYAVGHDDILRYPESRKPFFLNDSWTF
jgi:hypothetical protein